MTRRFPRTLVPRTLVPRTLVPRLQRALAITLAALLLGACPALLGCSSTSDFWDRSPRVAGARQPDWVPRQQPTPRAEFPAPRRPMPESGPAPRPAPLQPAPMQAPTPACGASAEEMEVLARVNVVRSQHGLRALRFHATLWSAAREHSFEQQRHGYMGHGSPDPRRERLSQRMMLAGYSGRVYAEVVAWGYTTTASVVEGWMNSSGHRSILLDGELTEAGFSRAGQYWTGNFGAPSRYAARPAPRTQSPRQALPPRAAPPRAPTPPRAPAVRAPAPRRAPAPDPFSAPPRRHGGG